MQKEEKEDQGKNGEWNKKGAMQHNKGKQKTRSRPRTLGRTGRRSHVKTLLETNARRRQKRQRREPGSQESKEQEVVVQGLSNNTIFEIQSIEKCHNGWGGSSMRVYDWYLVGRV